MYRVRSWVVAMSTRSSRVQRTDTRRDFLPKVLSSQPLLLLAFFWTRSELSQKSLGGVEEPVDVIILCMRMRKEFFPPSDGSTKQSGEALRPSTTDSFPLHLHRGMAMYVIQDQWRCFQRKFAMRNSDDVCTPYSVLRRIRAACSCTSRRRGL